MMRSKLREIEFFNSCWKKIVTNRLRCSISSRSIASWICLSLRKIDFWDHYVKPQELAEALSMLSISYLNWSAQVYRTCSNLISALNSDYLNTMPESRGAERLCSPRLNI
jgi:hypothetical protein